MARIDRFIKPLCQTGADRLILAAGEKFLLASGAQQRAMTTEPASAVQVNGFLEEILPQDLLAAIAAGQTLDFPYVSPHGTVLVSVSGSPAAPRVTIEPVEDGSAAARPESIAAAATQGAAVEPRVMRPAAGEPARTQAAPAPPAAPQHGSALHGSATHGAARQAESPAAAARAGAPAIDALFRKMVQQKCSDLHISTGNPPLVRKDGDIVPLEAGTPLTAEQARDLLYAITPQQYREEFEARHDSDFSYEIPGVARFRCNIFRDRLGMGGVFRVIPTKIPSAEELGLSKHILELCHLNKGLIVVTGPTGSGKSTTLAAMIDYINRNLNAHLITIEDPIEFVHQNRQCLINQREIGNHTMGFKQALRAALREDPDIVLVGEMRDLETVSIAIETAETGHLVFGTLHTNTAPSTVDRIIDQFPTDRQAQVRTMLSESLKGVIAQTLCKKKGGGRVAAQEVLIVNSAVSNLIREGKTFQIQSIMQTGKGSGMVCMNDSLYDLVQKNLVEAAEAYAKSIGKTEFRALLARGGVKLDAA